MEGTLAIAVISTSWPGQPRHDTPNRVEAWGPSESGAAAAEHQAASLVRLAQNGATVTEERNAAN